MQFKPMEAGIEVNGQTVYAVVDGFASKALPSKILVAEGVGTLGRDGVVEIDKDGWYSQEAWLRAFGKISESVGSNVLFNIGLKIPSNAIFPPWVVDVDSAIKSIDVAYHLNHRRQGKVMFDPANGTMLEGIGHYGYERPAPGVNRIVSKCANPYPCDFDRGILTTMAQKFAPRAMVLHQDDARCRLKGGESCTYVVKW